jgi:hypothetical protein
LLPAALTQDDHVVISRDIFSRKEIATQLRLNAKDGKEIGGNAERPDHLSRLTRFRQARITEGISADVAICLHLATKVEVIRSRDAALGILWSNPIQPLQLFALRIWERLE